MMMASRSTTDHKADEKVLKAIRINIEKIKHETIERMETMNIKSPRDWRDPTKNYSIRRRLINRESSIEEHRKEELYNSQDSDTLLDILKASKASRS
jgi:hypothetical protein